MTSIKIRSVVGAASIALFAPSAFAQASNDFESNPSGNVGYVDLGDPAVAHPVPNNAVPETQPNAGIIGTNLGFVTTFEPTRTGASNTGLTDGDLLGVTEFGAATTQIDFALNPPTNGGSNIFVFEDTDGLVTTRFSPVDLTGTTVPRFSFEFIMNDTDYETDDGAEDLVRIVIEIDGGASEVVLIDTTGQDIDATGIDSGAWQTFSINLSANIGSTVQLVVQTDLNDEAEQFAIDQIDFSEGTIVSACLPAADASFGASSGLTAPFGDAILSTTQPPALGTTAQLDIAYANPNTSAGVMFLTLLPLAGPLPFGGVDFLVDFSALLAEVPFTSTMGATINLPLSTDTALCSAPPIYFQAIIVDTMTDPMGDLPLIATNGVQWTIGT